MRSIVVLALLLAALAPGASHAQCVVNVPHVDGQWTTLPYLMPINPISATLLHDGRVLIVAGSEYDAVNNSGGSESYRNALWDPTGTDQTSIVVEDIEYDVFCSAVALLPDGRPLVVGGTSDYTVHGDSRASIFDPATSMFLQSQSMADGRWYAGTTTLGDGRVMALSGISSTGGVNQTVEIYDLRNAGAGWTSPVAAPFSPPLFPRAALLPSGKVFFTGQGGQGNGSALSAWFFDPATTSWTASVRVTMDRHYGGAVLLPLVPPAYTPRVMQFGGGNPATATTEIIDLSGPSPAWVAGPSMSTGRIQMNATLLPNGKVLALGGSPNNEVSAPATKHADLYDPITNAFGSGGTEAYSRLYHSASLLLPDATVVAVGSNPGTRGKWEPSIEIYTPAYLFDASDHLITTDRPAITGAPSGPLGYNTGFSVTYTSVSPIASAVLVRPGSATHSFDMEQRLVGLCGASPQPACTGGMPGRLDLVTPPTGNVAPPGYYMLFLLDSAGVPSKAQFIQLSPYTTTPPEGAITSPATDVTIPAGGTVSFGTTSSAVQYSWIFPGGSPATSTAQNPGSVRFATPGCYTVSMTAIDASGNSDPSPPTRMVTVTPPSPDFDLSVSPSARTIAPGQPAPFTVTVTPEAGFSAPVSLSVTVDSGFPAGVASGGFNPSTITGSGSSTLTINTSVSAKPFAVTLTVTGASGTITHTASTTVLIRLAPPASLTATGGDRQVVLSWPAVTGANGYRVKRSTTNGGPYVAVACPTTPSFTDTGLSNSTTYFYVVSSTSSGGTNGGGESADSVQASATTQLAVPPAPTGLTATPGDSQVALTWNVSQGAASYNVKRSTTTGGPYGTIANPIGTAFTDFTAVNGTTYFYVVSALNSAGESGNSAEVSATPQATATTTTTTTATTTTTTTTTAPPTTSTTSSTTTSTTATTTTAPATTTTATTTTSTTTTTIAGAGTANWGPSFVAWWPLDEASGTRAQAAGTCGASCNLGLTGASPPGNDPTNFVQGTAAVNLVATSGQWVGCNQQTGCSALNPNGTTSFAYGAWVRPHTLGTTRAWIRNRPSGAGFTGVLSSGNTFQCAACNASGCALSTSTTVATADRYYHVVCSFTAGSNTLQAWVNGAADGAPASHAIAASTAANFSLGVDSGTTWNGQVDEAFFYGGALAGPSICRITSCGIDGSLCACDAATPSSYRACAVDADCGGTARCDTTSGLCQGRRHATQNGGGCTLPACNQPTP